MRDFTNLKEIDDQHKKIEEKENIIHNLSNEITSKNDYIKQKEEEFELILSQKDEKIKKLTKIIENLKQKLTQIQKENKILYKFKDLYNENASKNIELEKNMNKYEKINDENIQLKKINEE